ncbi:hypothetical protein E0H75_42415 [Kribbella capetownensis]|uniref:DUF2637 domain-containing protein n=1 Tax=Kribbella capetownensis TaxID=1572659 RepID=A0A4R0IK86_9ACTN|nr:hypothetical protein [Kribbella capetownensis]TCC33911.1 hypothetical protein E0H75_42415 [Kribbella capetownensis]
MTDLATDRRLQVAPVALVEIPEDPAQLHELARRAYKKSVADHQPLSGKALGEMFRRGESWGRGKIREFRDEQVQGDQTRGSGPVQAAGAAPAHAERDTARRQAKSAATTTTAELGQRRVELAAETGRGGQLEVRVEQLLAEASALAHGRDAERAAHREEVAALQAEHTRVVDAMKIQAAALSTEQAQRRRKVGMVLVLVACAAAMTTSGWGMWTFLNDLGRLPWPMVTAMFLLFDAAAVACAWLGRINRLQNGRMGAEGALVWVFAVLSGVVSASDADGREAWIRFLAPMVAAVMFELLIRGERRDLTNHEGPVARIRRRALARFGLLDDIDQDDEQAARSRTAARLATLAYRVHQTKPDTAARRRAVGRYHRRLRVANERMGFATNAEMVRDVRIHLDSLFRSVSGTSAEAVTDVDVWSTPTLTARARTAGGEQ